MKNLGLIAIMLGAIMMIVGMLGDPLGVSALSDLCDINAYTLGALVLIIVGFICHIYLNKKYVD
jgi:uncharacterized protein YebE (UPF0316 family)